MTCNIIDGKSISSQILNQAKSRIAELWKDYKIVPSLGIIYANNSAASESYICRKIRACREVGILCRILEWRNPDRWHKRYPDTVLPEDGPFRDYNSRDYVRWKISEMNSTSRKEGKPYCDGMIVQLPVKDVTHPMQLCQEIHPLKDVDCFHPENLGLAAQGRPVFLPCTPAGIIELLKRSEISLTAKKVAIINNSNIVGKPLALLLTMEGATVTICHHRSNPQDVKEICRNADIIVVAIGKPHFLDRNYVRTGQVVIDVGVSRVNGKLTGDVHPEVQEIVEALTPCIGGVGPMTVSMLIQNTVEAAYLQSGI